MAKPVAKKRICLVCWNADLAEAHARGLSASGFHVHVAPQTISGWITYFRDLGVDAVVIDLDRLPSHGREAGTVLRGSKSTRHLPLVYLGGAPAKVDRLRLELPDAVYAEWKDAAVAIRNAIQHPVHQPVRPLQMMERNKDRDLARRLGVAPGVHVVAWGDAEFLRELLGDVPEGAAISTRVPSGSEAALLWLCVVHTAADVEAAFDAMVMATGRKVSGWIVHPKQTSRFHTDFNQNDVRDIGLAHGWVDFKVCAIDKDWSGLKFAPRRQDQAVRPHMMKRAAKKVR